MNKTIKDFELFQNILKLKYTYRYSERLFNGEKESTADHTWFMFVVADYLLVKLEEVAPGKYNLDRLKIYEMIIYHDLIEAETGDVDLNPIGDNIKKRLNKKEIEEEALKVFVNKIPIEIKQVYEEKIHEYEERKSLESKFVKLVDIVEPDIQCIFFPERYKEWTREFFLDKKTKYYNAFPELKFILEEILEFLDQNHYLKK